MFVLFCLNPLIAQKLVTDTVGVKLVKTPMAHPKKAALLSLIPGAGQAYNKKYWKMPIIYAGFGALTYSFIFYSNEFSRVREAYKQKINNQPISDPEFENVPEDMLYRVRESYRKSRDLSAIGMAGLYILNIIDAAVDAHLKGFDVSDKLSLRVMPDYNYWMGNTYVGVNLKLSIK